MCHSQTRGFVFAREGDVHRRYKIILFMNTFQAELSCRFLGPESIAPIRTRGHYVTLKFTADSWGTEANKFTMVITAFKDPGKFLLY